MRNVRAGELDARDLGSADFGPGPDDVLGVDRVERQRHPAAVDEVDSGEQNSVGDGRRFCTAAHESVNLVAR